MGALLGISRPIAVVMFGLLASAFPIGLLFESSGVAVCIFAAALYIPFKELRGAKY